MYLSVQFTSENRTKCLLWSHESNRNILITRCHISFYKNTNSYMNRCFKVQHSHKQQANLGMGGIIKNIYIIPYQFVSFTSRLQFKNCHVFYFFQNSGISTYNETPCTKILCCARIFSSFSCLSEKISL